MLELWKTVRTTAEEQDRAEDRSDADLDTTEYTGQTSSEVKDASVAGAG